MGLFDDPMKWARRQLAPMTIGLMATLAATSLFFWFTHAQGLRTMAFDHQWLAKPWSLLTYPFAFIGIGDVWTIITSLIVLAWMIQTCASVERTIGTPKYAALWAATTVVPALLIWIGCLVTHQPFLLAGPFLPIAAVSFIWARNNKSYVMNLWGVLPLNGVILSWVIAAGVLFGYGIGAPLVGVFAVLYLIPCFYYAENKIPFYLYEVRGYQKYVPSKAQKEKESRYFDEVKKREKEREEKERLRKLFESSIKDDDNR